MNATMEVPQKVKAEPKHKWLFTCDMGGSTTPADHQEAARMLVHYQLAHDETEALVLLEENAHRGGVIPIKALGHGVPGKCTYLGPNDNPPQSSKRVSKKG